MLARLFFFCLLYGGTIIPHFSSAATIPINAFANTNRPVDFSSPFSSASSSPFSSASSDSFTPSSPLRQSKPRGSTPWKLAPHPDFPYLKGYSLRISSPIDYSQPLNRIDFEYAATQLCDMATQALTTMGADSMPSRSVVSKTYGDVMMQLFWGAGQQAGLKTGANEFVDDEDLVLFDDRLSWAVVWMVVNGFVEFVGRRGDFRPRGFMIKHQERDVGAGGITDVVHGVESIE